MSKEEGEEEGKEEGEEEGEKEEEDKEKNDSETPLHIYQAGHHLKDKMKNNKYYLYTEKLEPLRIAAGMVKAYSHCRVMQQFLKH